VKPQNQLKMKTRKYKTIQSAARQCYYKEISLVDFINGQMYHKTLGWIKFKVEEFDAACLGFAQVIYERKAKSKLHLIKSAKPCGILRRLTYDSRYDHFGYCAGQDYPSEIKFIQRLLRK